MKATPPQSKQIRVNGLELHYLDWGANDRQPILLLHGFLSNARIWDSFASRISSKFHVLALDQRGHGISNWAKDGAYSLDDHFTDLARFIELLDLKNLIMFGHSMGGRNALFYTACCPERVKGLILVDARPANTDESVSALKNLLSDFSPGTATEYDPNLILGVELAGYMVEELWPLMESLTCPALVIRGEYSRFLSREEADRMCHLIQRAELVEMPRTSHLPMLESPTAFREAVSSFLDRLPIL